MNLKEKTIISAKKNVYLSLCLAFICLLFSLLILSGSTWAWFSAEYQSHDNTITIGTIDINLFLKKLDKVDNNPKYKMINKNRNDNNSFSHELVIDQNGDYTIGLIPSEEISGYCNLRITDENDKSLLDKDSLIINFNKNINFKVHTNKTIKIAISNINWGNLKEYDELKEDYYFSDFKFIYDNGTIEYSELPEGYNEVSYIASNGKQHIEDIILNEEKIVFETTFGDKIEGKKVIVDDNDQALAYIYPCVNENRDGGLYVFDLIDNKEKFYPNIGEGNFDIGDIIYHHEYELINNESNIDVLYKDVIVEGKMNEDDIVYSFGEETNDKVKDCAYKMEGFHFVGWKYEDKFIENLNDVLTIIDPTSEQEVILKAVWDIDCKTLVLDNQINDFLYRGELLPIDNLPEKEGYNFKGYYLNNELIIDSDGNFVKDPFDWKNNENEIVLVPRWETIINNVDNENIIEKTNDNIEETSDDSSIIIEEDIQNPTEETENQSNIDEQGVINE